MSQPTLFDLDIQPDEVTEYRHEVLVGDCLHVIVSIYPEVDASTRGLAEWSHEQRCEVTS